MRVRIPKQYNELSPRDKEIIAEYVNAEVQRRLEEEQIQLQRIWLQFACIVLHKVFWFTKSQLFIFLANWRWVYSENSKLKTSEEQKNFIRNQLDNVFEGDYPEEFISSLERIGDEELNEIVSKNKAVPHKQINEVNK